jgi:hypothetical protein
MLHIAIRGDAVLPRPRPRARLTGVRQVCDVTPRMILAREMLEPLPRGLSDEGACA